MDEFGKTRIKGKIRIVTPVHIGGAQEKHWVKGIDFLTYGSKVYLLDEKKIVNEFGIEKYSNALVNKSLSYLLKGNLSDFSKKNIDTITGEIGTDIKTCIRNSLSGKPIIPGTSLKGALRSVIYNYIVENNPPNNEDQVFGKIQENIFRFMIVNDSEFHNTSFINTKTFNLRNTTNGGWKHGFEVTNNNFNDSGFTFPHEVIPIDDFSEFEIVFNSKTLATVKNEQNNIDILNKKQGDHRPKKPNILKSNYNSLQVFEGTQDSFFKIIHDYTKKYLESEKAFFEIYGANKSELIISQIEYLIGENKENAPLLRLGLGSGFHAMTGDTHFINAHDNTGIWGSPFEKLKDGFTNNPDFDEKFKKFGISFKESKKREGSVRFKSRKLAFSGSGDNLVFYPLGFVQLCSDDYFNEHFKPLIEQKALQNNAEKATKAENEKKRLEQIEKQKLLKDEQIRLEIEQKAKEEERRLEALKPKMSEVTSLKKPKWVDAKVVGQNGRMLLFKPFIIGFEDKIFEIGYAAGMPENTIIQVTCSSQNAKTLQFQGSPRIKS